jgi:hypothetical protein
MVGRSVQGVRGAWHLRFLNDMNEPSIFYTAESLANLSEMMKGLKNDGGIDTDFSSERCSL